MKYVIANWKMNLSVRESVSLARGVLRILQGREHIPQLVVCPSFTALAEVQRILTRTHVKLGAQNAGPERFGAYTGEVGLAQLEDVGCEYALVGHSERRQRFYEDDALIRERMAAVLASSITPVLCVGESAEIREAGQQVHFVLKQLKAALADQKFSRAKRILIAYEPVWAIGSGTAATPREAVVMHTAIRDYLTSDLNLSAERIAVVYGGSVTGENAQSFLREDAIDGVLVGGASMQALAFAEVVEAACEVVEAQA